MISDKQLTEIAEATELAARAGARELMKLYGKISIREKGPRDLVTEADLASQNAIQGFVAERFPDHLFVGEESGSEESGGGADGETSDEQNASSANDSSPLTISQLASNASDKICWIVDPLDGTTNYAHGLNAFAVSVAVVQSGKVLAGAIYDPSMNEMFAATRNRGATLNGEPINSSDSNDLDSSLVAASFSANVTTDSPEIARFIAMLERCRAVRRLGSAALNLCYVAAGRLDGYWATSVKTWDIAAGFLIATEAGARMTQIDGSELDIWEPRFVAAANPELHKEMQLVLETAK